MEQVFVVFYDEVYPGYGERGGEQRKIEGVFASADAARLRVREIERMSHVSYADFDGYEVEE